MQAINGRSKPLPYRSFTFIMPNSAYITPRMRHSTHPKDEYHACKAGISRRKCGISLTRRVNITSRMRHITPAKQAYHAANAAYHAPEGRISRRECDISRRKCGISLTRRVNITSRMRHITSRMRHITPAKQAYLAPPLPIVLRS